MKNYITSDIEIEKKDGIRIAIFGESSARGFGSEASFSKILSHEFKYRCLGALPNPNIYFTNYAVTGRPFHRFQAEIFKKVIPENDLFIFYGGNNEYMNFADDMGLGRNEPFKKHHQVMRFDLENPWKRFFQDWSSLYGFFHQKLSDLNSHLEVNDYSPYEHFESSPNFPWVEVERMHKNFAKDIRDISNLIKSERKELFLSNVMTNEGHFPWFSILPSNLPKREEFLRFLELGSRLFQQGKWDESLMLFKRANKIYSGASLNHYWLGHTYLKKKEYDKSFFHFQKGIDLDSSRSRAHSQLNDTIRSASDSLSIHFVDSQHYFRSMVKGGVDYQDLFVDLVHPNLEGHILIASALLPHILKTKYFKNCDRSDTAISFSKEAMTNLVENYKKEMKLTPEHEGMAQFYAGVNDFHGIYRRKNMPNFLLERVQSHFEKSINLLPQSNPLRFEAVAYLSLVYLLTDKKAKSLILINKLARADLKSFHKKIKSKKLGALSFESILEQNGISFSHERGLYYLVG